MVADRVTLTGSIFDNRWWGQNDVILMEQLLQLPPSPGLIFPSPDIYPSSLWYLEDKPVSGFIPGQSVLIHTRFMWLSDI